MIFQFDILCVENRIKSHDNLTINPQYLERKMRHEQEIDKIVNFIKKNSYPNQKAIIGVSGGLDSDVVARLTCKALGKNRVKLFVVIQSDMEDIHLKNARNLAKDLKIELIEIPLKDMPYEIVSKVGDSDKKEGINKNGFLDTARTKVALRTVINSIYQDKGYKVIGTSNRTEIELGFFLPFGDGIAHLKPIAHLYKTDVFKIAKILGTNKDVLNIPPSAGLWEGETDLEDISYWIYNEAPIQREINFTKKDIKKVEDIHLQISIEKLDLALFMIYKDKSNKSISKITGFSDGLVLKLRNLLKNSKKLKHQSINKTIYD